MILSCFTDVVIGLALLLLMSGIDSLVCPTTTTEMDVASTADLTTLIDALNCTGGGVFDVIWYGTLDVDQIIAVSDGSHLTVTGVGSGSSNSTLGHETDVTDGMDAGSYRGMFFVSEGSTLNLNHLLLKGGQSYYGGAVSVVSDSALNIFGCEFMNNNASNGGAIFANNSMIDIDGTSRFTDNSADRGGAIYMDGSSLSIGGETEFTYNNAMRGGAIAMWNSQFVMTGTTTFNYNSAYDHGGGAIYGNGCMMDINSTSTFSHNVAVYGGGIYVYESQATVSGNLEFLSNTASLLGGAVEFIFSLASMSGQSKFMNNSAVGAGGGLYVHGSEFYMSGTATFENSNSTFGGGVTIFFCYAAIGGQVHLESNSAELGGALGVQGGEFNMSGLMTFTGNDADFTGGGLHLVDTSATIGGQAHFESNTAAHGGAISFQRSNTKMSSISSFTNNSASVSGGAIYMDGNRTTIEGQIEFVSNSARSGGGIYSHDSAALYLDGQSGYLSNDVVNGGVTLPNASDVNVSGSISFTGNTASFNGGAISIYNGQAVNISYVTFTSNKAELGGAVYLFSTADGFTDLKGCIFEENDAADGGAINSYFGGIRQAIIRTSVFRGNYARYAGGAIFQTGSLNIAETTLVANQAGKEGAAVMSVGLLEKLIDVTFSNNSFSCSDGEYGYDKEIQDGNQNARFELVCARCETGNVGISNGANILSSSTIPVCEDTPEGTIAESSGTTIATLTLQEGYFRTSYESADILKCYQTDACVGGRNADKYCGSGYTGAYCAVCSKNYAPGVSHSCSVCSAGNEGARITFLAAVCILMLLVVAVIVFDLVRVINDGSEEESGFWKKTLSGFREFLLKAFPLTSIKIIVVVWQILTQFAAITGHVFPDVYESFLSSLNLFNFDIGFILAYSCIVTTNFYDRLLLVTIGPLVGFAFLGASYAIARKRNKSSEVAKRVVHQKHMSAAVTVMFFVYSSASFTIFQTFVCDTLDDGESYLRADYSLHCFTKQNSFYRVYAGVMMCVYPFGIPILFMVLLARHREDLRNPNRNKMVHLKSFSGLWAPYKPSRYYYEVVECGRRILLTGVAVFVFPDSTEQIEIVFLIALVIAFAADMLSPFQEKIDQSLYRWGNGIILASMYVALLLKIDVSGEGTVAMSAFAGVLVLANVFMVVTVLFQCVLWVKVWRTAVKTVEVVGPVSRATSTNWLEDAESDDEMKVN